MGLSAWSLALGLAAPADYFAVPEELRADGEGRVRFGVPRGAWIGVLVQPEQGLIATKVLGREEILAGDGSIPDLARGLWGKQPVACGHAALGQKGPGPCALGRTRDRLPAAPRYHEAVGGIQTGSALG